MAYDAAHRVVVMFGGMDAAQKALGDTWIWTGSHWAQKFPADKPSPRSDAGMTFDAARGVIVLFGGAGPGAGDALNDTWTWDGTDWHEQHPAHQPDRRFGFGFAYDPPVRESLMFGFTGSASPRTPSTWAWDGSDWTALQTALPNDLLFGPSAVYQPSTSSLVAVGAKTWKWTASAWVELASSGPQGRQWAPMALDATGSAVLYAGVYMGVNDTWVWDGGAWKQLNPLHVPTNPSQGSSPAAFAFDAATGQTVLFGGSDANASTWTWDGSDWTDQTAAASAARLG